MAAQLKTPENVEGSSTDQVVKQATHLEVTQLDIQLEGDGNGQCVVTYELGTMSGGAFVPLSLVEADRTRTLTIDGDDFYSMANTAISPSERYLTLYNIIRRRINERMVGLEILLDLVS